MGRPSIIPAVEPEWERGPATSHVYGWYVRNEVTDDLFVPRDGVEGTLTVAFKVQAGGRVYDSIASVYDYDFPTIGESASWLAKFRTASHPGEIVDQLVKSGNRGKRRP